MIVLDYAIQDFEHLRNYRDDKEGIRRARRKENGHAPLLRGSCPSTDLLVKEAVDEIVAWLVAGCRSFSKDMFGQRLNYLLRLNVTCSTSYVAFALDTLSELVFPSLSPSSLPTASFPTPNSPSSPLPAATAIAEPLVPASPRLGP
ncbi:hypothetical protein LXA43DRAFT_1068331, partial [Ganoderma leucocontextum]